MWPKPSALGACASASPVLALAFTRTSSHVLRIELLGQMISMRSEPDTPAPARRVTLVGAGAVAHKLGVLLLPTLNWKSLTVMPGCAPEMSTMMPLIPRE